jgi:F-type H+-transporting ATPase subunit gamma
MASILDIKRRIRSVRNTRQITKAMQMVSAAKLRRAQERALAARPYAQMLNNVLKSLVSRAEVYDPVTGEALNPLLVRREEKNILILVVAGEKGLAGAFNSNIMKAAMRFILAQQGKNVDIVAIGRKSRDFFRRRYQYAENGVRGGEIQMAGEHVGILNRVRPDNAREVGLEVVRRYTAAEIDSVYLVYNEFKSVIAQRLVVEEVLPIGELGAAITRTLEQMSPEERQRALEAARVSGASIREADTTDIDKRAAAFGTAPVDYIYEQDPTKLFNALMPRYLGMQIYRAMLESEAAEHAARMTAMDAATNNASDMIDNLTLAMNRVRQSKITKEIIEIVSGAAAL